MCGRFVSASDVHAIEARFGIARVSEAAERLVLSYNVAPATGIRAVTSDDHGRSLDVLRWGLVPFWAKDPSIGSRMINARAETLAEKKAFKHAFAHRRCLIPADGFYEWERLDAGAGSGSAAKQPWYIFGADGKVMAFAGLWEKANVGGEPLLTCTIVTTAASDDVKAIHDRMPAILGEDDWDIWLDPEFDDPAVLGTVVAPAPVGTLKMHRVGREVGRVSNNGPELVDAMTGPDDDRLF